MGDAMSLDIHLYTEVDLGGPDGPQRVSFESFNATHNLVLMWDYVGAYDALYNSDGRTAESTIPALEAALAKMEADPDGCRAFDSPNGWGTYDSALRFLRNWLHVCRQRPKALISVWK